MTPRDPKRDRLYKYLMSTAFRRRVEYGQGAYWHLATDIIEVLALEAAPSSDAAAPLREALSYPSPGESEGFDALVDALRAEFVPGDGMPWDEIVAFIAARLPRAASPSDPAAPLDVERLADAIFTARISCRDDEEWRFIDDGDAAERIAREYAALTPEADHDV